VFERFRQAEATMSRRYGGLGLGLGIVRHLVELHGGTVRAESDGEERGATFTVELPLTARPRAKEPIDEPTGPGASELRGLSVLLVEDEPEGREMLLLVLEQHGARVRAVESARAAVAAFEAERPDVLVSDIGLPGEDGYTLIRKLRLRDTAAGGHVPALALTAYARPQDREDALAAGFSVHLAKPVDTAALVEEVARLARTTPPRVG
jgi:CheY-like chemotaxis protein